MFWLEDPLRTEENMYLSKCFCWRSLVTNYLCGEAIMSTEQ